MPPFFVPKPADTAPDRCGNCTMFEPGAAVPYVTRSCVSAGDLVLEINRSVREARERAVTERAVLHRGMGGNGMPARYRAPVDDDDDFGYI